MSRVLYVDRKCDATVSQRLDMLASCSVEAPTLESVRSVELAVRIPEDPCRTSMELETKQNVKEANTCRLRSSNTSLSHFSPSCTLRSAHQSRGQSARSLRSFSEPQLSDALWWCAVWKIVVQRLVGQEDQRKKQGARRDRSKRLLGTLSLRLLWRGEEEKERFGCSRDVNGARRRRE